MKATWNGVVIAESDNTEVVEGNHYFPPDAINASYFKPSSFRTTCPWKGEAHYYHVEVGDAVNEKCRMVLPRTVNGGSGDQRSCRILEWCRGGLTDVVTLVGRARWRVVCVPSQHGM